MRIDPRETLIVAVVVVMAGCSNPSPETGNVPGDVDPEYVRQVEDWRSSHEADYIRDYVPLAGLFFLEHGVNTAGSAPDSQIRLPERLPRRIGRFEYEGSRVRFDPNPDAGVSLNGEPLTGPVDLRPDSEAVIDELGIDDIRLWIHMSAERHTVRLRDPQSEFARDFAGFRWFPVDARYRVVGTFVRDLEPRDVQVPSLTGDDQTYTTEGIVEFTLNGQPLHLRPMMSDPDRFFFIFRDATAGTETYEAARFLYADLLDDDTTILDFNQAYNPPCAFNPFTTCPLPPPENRLTVAIRAGELAYAHSLK